MSIHRERLWDNPIKSRHNGRPLSVYVALVARGQHCHRWLSLKACRRQSVHRTERCEGQKAGQERQRRRPPPYARASERLVSFPSLENNEGLPISLLHIILRSSLRPRHTQAPTTNPCTAVCMGSPHQRQQQHCVPSSASWNC